METARAISVTLICLPYAGGSASVFREWRALLPPWIALAPLQLPGRGARYREPILGDWPSVRRWLLDASRPHRSGPFAIFGHSMGALLGFELAHAHARDDGGLNGSLVWFGASGCVAPVHRHYDGHWLDAPRARIVERLQALGGTPLEVLGSDDLLELAIPALRGDFHLCSTYERPRDRAALACPMLVLGGKADPISRRPTDLVDWCAETTGSARTQWVDGGHFILEQAREEVISHVVGSLGEAMSGVIANRATRAPGESPSAPIVSTTQGRMS